VLLGGKNEPNGFVVEGCLLIIGIIIANQSLLGCGLFLLFLVRLDMAQQCGGSFGDLGRVSMYAVLYYESDIPGAYPADTVIPKSPSL